MVSGDARTGVSGGWSGEKLVAKVRTCQIYATELVCDGDGAQRRAKGIRSRADQNDLTTAIILNNARHLRAADAEAGRWQIDFHGLGAGFGQLSRHKSERAFGNICCHRARLLRWVIDKLVNRQTCTAAQCEYGFIKAA